MNQRKAVALALLGILMSFAAMTAAAQDIATMAVIEDDVFGGVHGVAAVNQAAGDANLQFNGAAVALNETGVALATITAVQRVAGDPGAGLGTAIARIDDRAFANGEGLISVNQASGRYNLQANLVIIAVGIEGVALAEGELSQSRSDLGLSAGEGTYPERVRREASVADTAFRNAGGIVQVNQAAGLGNTSANIFALSVSAGAKP